MVSFSEDLEDFNWRLRVEAAPSVPSARRLRIEEGSGIGLPLGVTVTPALRKFVAVVGLGKFPTSVTVCPAVPLKLPESAFELLPFTVTVPLKPGKFHCTVKSCWISEIIRSVQ